MFKSLYRMHRNEDRIQPEAVLTGKGVFVMLLIFLSEQLAAQGISALITLFDLPLGVMDVNLIVNGGAMLLMFFFFGGFFIENLKSFFREFKAIYVWLPLTCYFCSTMANVMIQVMLAFVRGEFQNTSNNALVIELINKYPLQLLLLTVLIAPITEEAVFRAAFCRPMTASGKGWLTVLGFVISILLFSFFHIYQFAFFEADPSGAVHLTFNFNEFLSILVYIPMSVGLALCSFFGRNYWCSVVCHMLTNAIAVFMIIAAGNLVK